MIPLPIATFAILIALSIVFTKIPNHSNILFFSWFKNNYIPILLGLLMLSSLVAITDYYHNPKVIDRLRLPFIIKAIETNQYQNSIIKSNIFIPNQEIWDMKLKEIKDNADKGNILTDDNILSLSPRLYWKVITDSKLQRQLNILNPISNLLSEIQLITGLFVASIILIVVGSIFLSRYSTTAIDLSSAIPPTIVALGCLSIYPLCFSYWSNTVGDMTGVVINNMGFVIAYIMITFLSIMLLINSPNKPIGDLLSLSPIFISSLSFFSKNVNNYIGYFIGIEANMATRIIVLICTSIIGMILLMMCIGIYYQNDRL
ncbi:MAG: hypothetical protein ORN26_02765 [Candidatus Pacebacteria bacterium]|nr:hypothetical protein [Candidatus Paceibacterota bacterium]